MALGLGGYMTDDDGKRLDEIVVVDEASMTDPTTGLGTLANAENITGQSNTITTTTVSVGFVLLTVDPSERDVWIEWGAAWGVAVAGAGVLSLVAYELTGSTPTLTEVDRIPIRIESTLAASGFGGKATGRFRIGPSASLRRYSMGGFVGRDAGSSLSALVRNAPAGRSYMTAVAR